MEQTLIFQPVFVLVALTLLMYMHLIMQRTAAVKNKEISPRYFRVLQGDTQPEKVAAADRNIINLFELPVLFYSAVVIAYVTNTVDNWLLGLAWVFAVSRVVHSAIHVTSNHVMNRLRVFFLGYAALIAFWVVLAWRLI